METLRLSNFSLTEIDELIMRSRMIGKEKLIRRFVNKHVYV